MTQFGNGSRSCFYFLFAVVHSTTPLTAAKFLYFHRLPCSRCLCRHAELLNSLLVALKICCFVQVELSLLVLPECMLILACAEEDRATWAALFSCVAAFLPLLSSSSRSSQGGAPLLSPLQLCSKKMLLCLMEEKAAEHFLKIFDQFVT